MHLPFDPIIVPEMGNERVSNFEATKVCRHASNAKDRLARESPCARPLGGKGTMGHLSADLIYACRTLRKAPLFAVVAIASIAFGVGTNSAVFTLLDQVVLRDLPVRNPGELVQVTAENTESYGGGMGDGTELSYAMFRDLRDGNKVFTGMSCRFQTPLHLSHGGQSERVNGELVSGNFFSLLGVTASVGRLFAPDDDRVVGGHPVAVLGYRFWRSQFNADPAVLGAKILINGHPYEIVGVSAPRFPGIDIGAPVQVYVPITMQPQVGPSWLKLEDRRFRWVQVYARLGSGMNAERARAGLQPLYHSLLEMEAKEGVFAGASSEARRSFLSGTLTVKSASRGHSGLRESLSDPLWILFAIAVGVLLIVSANVANLLIARGATREGELALRVAIGATRWQVVRLLLVESALLAAVGAVLGLFLARWGAALLLGFFVTPDNLIAVSADANGRVLLFTVGVAGLTVLAAGLFPAFRGARIDLARAMKGSGARSGGRTRLREGLVVAQVALSFLLLIGAGLFLRSLGNLLRVDPGFKVERVLSFSFDLERSGYGPERAKGFTKVLLDTLSTTPGVSASGYAFFGLLEGGAWGMGFTVEGYRPKPGDGAGALCNAVSPGFFRTLGVPLVTGREFTERDDREGPPPKGWPYSVAVVNEMFARRYFGGENPIGRHIGIGEDPGTLTPIEIVGLVKDTRYTAIREKQQPQVFFPYLQAKEIENVTAYIRTDADPEALMRVIRLRVASLDSSLPIYNVSTLEQRVEQSVVNERMIAALSAALSGMATSLSVIGLYGVIAFTVTRKTREIGIRMALGALASQIALRVLRDAGALVAGGLTVGLGAAWWLGRYVQSQLYGVAPADVPTMALAAAVLIAVAALAAALPARRAARIAPMVALREE